MYSAPSAPVAQNRPNNPPNNNPPRNDGRPNVENARRSCRPPVVLELVGGKAEADVNFDGIDADERNQVERRYKFFSPADKVYWVKTGEFAQANVRVEGPAGEIDPPKDRWGNRERTEMAFEAKQAGEYTVTLTRSAHDAKPLKLTVREMDGSAAAAATPPEARGALPRIAEVKVLNVYDKQFASAAFSTDGKSFYMSHADGTLSYWADGKEAGAFKTGEKNRGLKQLLFGLAVDHEGRVYAQSVTTNEHGVRIKRGVGDISVYAGLVPKGAGDPLPAPDKTLKLGGIVAKMLASPDGKYVYFLDVHNRKVGRIDADAGKIDGEIESISAGAVDVPDGRRQAAVLLLVGQQDRRHRRGGHALDQDGRVRQGQPADIAATNAGLVFMAGWGTRDGFDDKGSAFMVDLTKEPPAEAKAVTLPIRYAADVVRVLPDQSTALFGADRHILACSIPSRRRWRRRSSARRTTGITSCRGTWPSARTGGRSCSTWAVCCPWAVERPA